MAITKEQRIKAIWLAKHMRDRDLFPPPAFFTHNRTISPYFCSKTHKLKTQVLLWQ